MKNLFFIACAFISICRGWSQTADTLFMTDGKKIPCKIYEISEYEMRYRVGGPEGTLYVIDKFKVRKYALSNGFSELVTPDELSVEHEHASILQNREVIKIHPFGFGFNHVSVAYEQVMKVGMNLDMEAGYINTDINSSRGSLTGMNFATSHTGAYFKPGMKFFVGQDYVVKGLRYSHPLKGSYIKLDLAISYLKFENIQTMVYSNSGVYPNTSTTSSLVNTGLISVAYGGFVNFGRQVILGNLFTMEAYAGIGITAQSNNYTNKDYLKTLQASNNGYPTLYVNPDSRISNYYGWARIPGMGLSFTCGFRLGYILPAKKKGRTAVSN